MEQSGGSFFLGVDGEFDHIVGQPNMTGTPERRLLLAILERAILDFVGNDERELEQAEQWLFAPERHDRNDHFSFEWVCEQLDLDPKRIAAKIKKMPRRGSRKVAPWYFTKHQPAAA
jgi:hypothetical protein